MYASARPKPSTRRGEVATRRTHNPETAGANPAGATGWEFIAPSNFVCRRPLLALTGLRGGRRVTPTTDPLTTPCGWYILRTTNEEVRLMIVQNANDAADLTCRRCDEDTPEGGYLVDGCCHFCRDAMQNTDDATMNPPVADVPRYDFTPAGFSYQWWVTL